MAVRVTIAVNDVSDYRLSLDLRQGYEIMMILEMQFTARKAFYGVLDPKRIHMLEVNVAELPNKDEVAIGCERDSGVVV